MVGENGEQQAPAFHVIGSGGEHGLGREVLCSLPRSISCRLCKGEHDCPYIVERPLGRLIVRKREPKSLVVRDLMYVATGSADALPREIPFRQKLVVAMSWAAIPLLLAWVIFVHEPEWVGLLFPAGVMLATFVFTIVGVPIVRWFWRDHGGKRRGGAWRPS